MLDSSLKAAVKNKFHSPPISARDNKYLLVAKYIGRATATP
jgi:hypothetical protein